MRLWYFIQNTNHLLEKLCLSGQPTGEIKYKEKPGKPRAILEKKKKVKKERLKSNVAEI